MGQSLLGAAGTIDLAKARAALFIAGAALFIAGASVTCTFRGTAGEEDSAGICPIATANDAVDIELNQGAEGEAQAEAATTAATGKTAHEGEDGAQVPWRRGCNEYCQQDRAGAKENTNSCCVCKQPRNAQRQQPCQSRHCAFCGRLQAQQDLEFSSQLPGLDVTQKSDRLLSLKALATRFHSNDTSCSCCAGAGNDELVQEVNWICTQASLIMIVDDNRSSSISVRAIHGRSSSSRLNLSLVK